MNDDARNWLSAWALALAFVGAIALAGHSPSPHGSAARGFDMARTRGLLTEPTNPRLLVNRDEPLVDPGDVAAEEPTPPEDGAPTRPIC